MDEAEAKAALNVPRETTERLEAFAALLWEENERQNLVSRSSLDHLWSRHIYDSAQLLRLAPPSASTWLDLGTGAGVPGLVAALLHPAHFTLVEVRKLRAEFLAHAADLLGVSERVSILCSKVEALPQQHYDVISARAFAPLPRLLELAHRFSTAKTLWILPKGRNARSELDAARASWQGAFRLEQSLTDPEAQIVVAEGVTGKGKRK
jgi:16S rRNA (guanine527-N7)-methyltransferase